MNKRVFTVFVVLGIIMTTKAQEITLGIKAGVNFSTLSGDSQGLDSRTSFHIGTIVEFMISDIFAVQPELLYSAQGAKADGDTLKMDYLILPIIGKYYVIEGLSLEIGPRIGYLLSAKTEIDDGGDITDEFREFDFGLNFGAAYTFETGLNFGVRYNLGLSNTVNYLDDFVSDYTIRNSVFQISVGYFF